MNLSFFASTVTLSGGLASTGAPRTPPARLFFRFSWTWVSCSSRSTLSASLTRHVSSSSETRLLRADFLLPATSAQKIKYSNYTSKYKTDRGFRCSCHSFILMLTSPVPEACYWKQQEINFHMLTLCYFSSINKNNIFFFPQMGKCLSHNPWIMGVNMWG